MDDLAAIGLAIVVATLFFMWVIDPHTTWDKEEW